MARWLTAAFSAVKAWVFLVRSSSRYASSAGIFRLASLGAYSSLVLSRAINSAKCWMRLSKLICETEMVFFDSSTSNVAGSSLGLSARCPFILREMAARSSRKR